MNEETVQGAAEYAAEVCGVLDAIGDLLPEISMMTAGFFEPESPPTSLEAAREELGALLEEMLAAELVDGEGVVFTKFFMDQLEVEKQFSLVLPEVAEVVEEDDIEEEAPKAKSGGNKKGKKRGGKKPVKKKASKVKVIRKADKNKANGGDDSVPMWLSPQAEKERIGNKDVNIIINMSVIGGGVDLLDFSNLILSNGHKYGLVGRNGVGKSTLLTHISEYMFPDFPKYLHVLHVQQEVVADSTTVLEVVLKADVRREMYLQKQAALELKLANADGADTAVIEYELDETFQQLKSIDSDGAVARACSILAGLQFSHDRINTCTRDLSGGWRMRVALAAALFVTPDILLLDEPTNHLDFPAVLWLEDYLATYEKTVVVVSHDRTFLNSVCKEIIHMHGRKLNYYGGNYETFDRVRTEKIRCSNKAYVNQQEKIAHQTDFINRFRANKKLSKMVQSRIKVLGKMERVELITGDGEMEWTFPEPSPLRKEEIVNITDVTFGYNPETILFRDVKLMIRRSSRIGILGANGTGKSTLIKLILQQERPIEGVVVVNRNANIGYFAQHHSEVLDLSMTPVEYLRSQFPDAKPADCFRALGIFGLQPDLAMKRIRTLSGGQKSRVAFAMMTWYRPHVIILDEPTNHCDMQTIDALIGAVSRFKGSVVIVSHDQHFLENTCSEYWTVKDGEIKAFWDFEEAKVYSYSKNEYAFVKKPEDEE